MRQWLGAVMVGISATWLGVSAAVRQYSHVRMLEELEQGLMALERELELAPVSLGALLERLEGCCTGSAKTLFRSTQKNLACLEEKPMAEIWDQALEELEGLLPGERRCLQSLGGVLGGYGAREQIRAVEGVREKLSRMREQCRAGAVRQGKVYTALGVTGGCFLIILFL